MAQTKNFKQLLANDIASYKRDKKPKIKFYSDGSIVRISTISLAYAISSQYVQAYTEFESAASCSRWTKFFKSYMASPT